MKDLTSEQERVLRIVNKLLRLASNNPSEEEAESAQLRVQQLLAEYNLKLEDLSEEEYRTQSVCDENRIELLPGKPPLWVLAIAGAMMAVYDVYGIQRRESSSEDVTIVFVGVDPALTIATEAFIAIYRHLVFLELPNYSISSRNDYCRGFVDGLYRKLMAQKASQRANCTAIVAVRTELMSNYMHEHYPCAAKSRRRVRVRDNAAYTSGLVDGNAYEINQRVTGTVAIA